jgi:hypothetical protein
MVRAFNDRVDRSTKVMAQKELYMSPRPQDIPLPAPISWSNTETLQKFVSRKDTEIDAAVSDRDLVLDWLKKNAVSAPIDLAAHTEVRVAEAEALREPLDLTSDYEAEAKMTLGEIVFILVGLAILIGIVLSTLVKSINWLPGQ